MPHLMASSASSSSPTCTNAPSAHLHTESKMSHSSFHQLIRQGHLSTLWNLPQGTELNSLRAHLLQQPHRWCEGVNAAYSTHINTSQHCPQCVTTIHSKAVKAACLSIAIPVLHDSPGQLRDGEGQRVAELQVGPPGLKVAAAEVLPAGALTPRAGVRSPRKSLQVTLSLCWHGPAATWGSTVQLSAGQTSQIRLGYLRSGEVQVACACGHTWCGNLPERC